MHVRQNDDNLGFRVVQWFDCPGKWCIRPCWYNINNWKRENVHDIDMCIHTRHCYMSIVVLNAFLFIYTDRIIVPAILDTFGMEIDINVFIETRCSQINETVNRKRTKHHYFHNTIERYENQSLRSMLHHR